MPPNPVAKLKARQADVTLGLKARIKAAQIAMAAKIKAAGENPLIGKSATFRNHFFGQVRTHYEALGTELDAWAKDITEGTAVDWHKVALDDIRTYGGKVNTTVLKFNRDRVRRYWEMIHPDNSQNLAAVFTQKMTATEIQNLRTAFIDASRQRQLEGWTQNTFQKEIQSRWDALAGNLASNRFVDSRGRAWSNANYLSMLARTTTARVARDSYFDTLIQNGDDLVRIGPSGDSCPICQAWIGVIISISGKHPQFPTYQDALDAGMFHPNCDCLQMRMDETVHAADIDRQANTKNPPDWSDPDTVQKYKDSFMADPSKPAQSTLANVTAKTGAAKQMAVTVQILDAAASSVADPVSVIAKTVLKKPKALKGAAKTQALKDQLAEMKAANAKAQAGLEAAKARVADLDKAFKAADVELKAIQGRTASIRAGNADPAFKQAQKAALDAQKAAEALKAEKAKLVELLKAQEDAKKIAAIEKAAADAKAKAMAAEQANAAKVAKAAKEAEQKARVEQILKADDLDSVGQTGAADFGKLLTREKADVVGGTQGSFVTSDPTGQKWVTKLYDGQEDRVRTEWTANQLYQTLGINVPKGRLAVFEGKLAFCSRMEPGVQDCLAANVDFAAGALQLRRGFVSDAWLANWDAAGANWDNLMLAPGKASSILRIDHGGALKYRAMGNMKPAGVWGDTVQEIETLRNPSVNPQTTRLFAKVTDEDIKSGVLQLRKLMTQEKLKSILGAGGWEKTAAADLERTLTNRKKNLVDRYLETGKKKKVAQEAVKESIAAAPIEGPVSQGELELIKASRQNGIAIRIDGGDIEDQSVLFWHETDARNRPVTSAIFKVRGKAADKLTKGLNLKTLDVVEPDAAVWTDDGLGDDMLTAIKGISARAGKGLEQKDFDRYKAAFEKFKQKDQKLKDLVDAGEVADESLAAYRAHYEPWMKSMMKAVEGKLPGEATTFKKPASGLFAPWGGPTFTPKPVAVAEQKAVNGLAMKDMSFKLDSVYRKKDIQSGFVKETGQAIGGSWEKDFPYAETELADGTIVRVWPNAAKVGNVKIPYAQRGQVQIIAQGQDTAAAERIRATTGRLGIKTARSTATEQEELYLNQIAYVRAKSPESFAEYEAAIEAAGKDQTARLTAAKEWLKKETGQDVTALPDYKPQGVYQAFGQGRNIRLRPDFAGKEWDALQADYRIHHQITGGEMAEKLDAILNTGGQLTATTDKLRRGFTPSGMSPKPDMESGGASYVFTRVRLKDYAVRERGIIWKMDQAKRLDAIHYGGDRYGSVKGGAKEVIMHRAHTMTDMKNFARSGSNELIFKNSLSIFDDLDKIIVSPTEKKAVMAVLKKHGWTKTWIDGRPLDEVVVTG